MEEKNPQKTQQAQWPISFHFIKMIENICVYS